MRARIGPAYGYKQVFIDSFYGSIRSSKDVRGLFVTGTDTGAGKTVLSAALLLESGARVCVVARNEIKWNPPSERQRSLWRRIRAPESGLAPGWRSLFYSELPGITRHIPVSKRHQIVATVLGTYPSCVHSVQADTDRAGNREDLGR